jgi:hypothetical protein
MGELANVKEILKPYIERLPNMLSMLKTQTVKIGDRPVVAGPWEIGLLNKMYKGELPKGTHWGELVAQGLALQIKTLQDLEALRNKGDGPAILKDPAFQPNVEASQALLADLQTAVNSLILKGDKENYKQLSAFRRVLYDLFFELKHGKA